MKLNDPQLLRTQACIDGVWCGADRGATFAVTNPAGGERLAAGRTHFEYRPGTIGIVVKEPPDTE